MKKENPTVIRTARPEEAAVMARMTGEGLNSRLSDLGPWFFKYLYRQMVTSELCTTLVAESANGIVGCAVTLHSTRRFYREFFLKKGLVAGLLVLPWLFRPRNIRTVLNSSKYSSKADHCDPEAEFVSIVVKPEARGMGVGRKLFQGTVNALKDEGITHLKITTPVFNSVANTMYQNLGCELIRRENFCNDVDVNVFYYEIP